MQQLHMEMHSWIEECTGDHLTIEKRDIRELQILHLL